MPWVVILANGGGEFLRVGLQYNDHQLVLAWLSHRAQGVARMLHLWQQERGVCSACSLHRGMRLRRAFSIDGCMCNMGHQLKPASLYRQSHSLSLSNGWAV